MRALKSVSGGVLGRLVALGLTSVSAAVWGFAPMGAHAQTALPSGTSYALETFPSGNPFTIANGVTISNAAGSAITGDASNTWILDNDGVILGTSANPVISFLAGGTITNGAGNASATIRGLNQGILFGAGGSVVNSGLIETTSTANTTNSGAIVFSGGNNTVTNNAGGQIIARSQNGRAISTAAGATATITNAGVISSLGTGSNVNAIFLASGGTVNNQVGGSITGTTNGVSINGAVGTVTNSGTISGDTGRGVSLNAGGTITNEFGGTLSGINSGAAIVGGSPAGNVIDNRGTITGLDSGTGVGMTSGGTFNNYATGVASGNVGANLAGGGTVNNYGKILGTTPVSFSALTLSSGNITVHNYGGGLIEGGQRGLYILTNATIINDANATISARLVSPESDYSAAVFIGNVPAGVTTVTILNAGTISATAAGNPGILFTGQISTNMATGDITNTASGVITGSSGVIYTNASATSIAPMGNIVNDGTITGTSGTGILGASPPLTISNGGTISGAVVGIQLNRGGTITNRTGGQIVSAGNAIVGSDVTVDSSGIISAGAGFNAVMFNSGTNALKLRSGSTTTGTVLMGTGSDSTTVYGGANVENVPLFDGRSMTSALSFDGYGGTAHAIQRWNSVDVVNGADVKFNGAELYSANSFHTDAQSALGFSGTTGTLTGMVNNDGTLDYRAGNGTGTYAISGDLTSGGAIFLGGADKAGSVLTVNGNYVGQSGALHLNTVLGADATATDRLVIAGAGHNASGSTLLIVTNTGGAGGITSGDGIMVVQAVSGATTAAEAFQLGNRVAAGAYEYALHYGGNGAAGGDAGDQNWYLRSTFTASPDSAVEIPLIRAEVAVDSAIMPLALEYGYAMLDTLHERMGETATLPQQFAAIEERTVRCNDRSQNNRCAVRVTATASDRPWFSGGWARIIGNRGSHDIGTGAFLTKGPAYDYTFGGIQAGLDIFGRELADGTIDKAGIYAGYGQITSDVSGQFGGKAGSVDMDAGTLGAYWTHRSPQGWYTDAVAQATWYAANARSVKGEAIKPDGLGVLGSLEAGYAFKLGNGFTLEPQAQIVYQQVRFDDARDTFGLINFHDSESLRGRLGARLTKSWNIGEGRAPRLITGWLRANLWHEFLGKSTTEFRTLNDGSPFLMPSQLGGTWAEIGAGVSGQVAEKVSLFATGAYQRSVDGKGREGWDGRLGMVVKW